MVLKVVAPGFGSFDVELEDHHTSLSLDAVAAHCWNFVQLPGQGVLAKFSEALWAFVYIQGLVWPEVASLGRGENTILSLVLYCALCWDEWQSRVTFEVC